MAINFHPFLFDPPSRHQSIVLGFLEEPMIKGLHKKFHYKKEILERNLFLAKAWQKGSTLEFTDLGKLLGEGGEGKVYEARVPGSRLPLACKVNDATYAASEITFDSALKRDQIYVRIPPHPNIVSYKGIAYDPKFNLFGSLFEKIEGLTLDAKVNPRSIENIMLPIARALQTLHNAQIAHKDLGLVNIMVSNNGVPQLIDFDDATFNSDEDLLRVRVSFANHYIILLKPDIFAFGASDQVIRNKLLEAKISPSLVELLIDSFDRKKTMADCSWDHIVRTLEAEG